MPPFLLTLGDCVIKMDRPFYFFGGVIWDKNGASEQELRRLLWCAL